MTNRTYALLLTAVLCLNLSGCLTPGEVRPLSRYVLEPELDAQTLVSSSEQSRNTVGIRPLSVARPYTTRIAYRDADLAMGYYNGVQWAEDPGPVVTRVLEDALRLTGRLADVGDASDMARPDLILTGEVRKFYEDRSQTPPVAHVEVNLELRRAQSVEVYFAQTFPVSVPIEGAGASDLAAAMNKAVARLAEDVAPAIAEAASQSLTP